MIAWVAVSGYLPVLIPNNLLTNNVLADWLQLIQPQALIFSGGNDLGEYPERDATERYLLSWAESISVPALGICRGMQIMSSWAGAKLVPVDGHVRTHHQLQLNDVSTDWPITVNSYHKWSVESCPQNFQIMAQAEDGAIEAIRHKHLPWEGWMWHPERELPVNPIDTMRMKRLFSER